MSLSSWLTQVFSARSRLDQRRMWQSASLSSRFLLLAAVFFLFASVGLLGDISSVCKSRLFTLAIWAVFGGTTAVAYLLVIMLRLRWLPVVIVLQLLASTAIGRIPDGPAFVPPGPAEQALKKRLTVNAMGTVGCIAISYALFVIFVTESGKRFIQLDTELSLARDIHRTLVPRVEERTEGFEFLGVSSPSGEVGGDLVDLVKHDGDPPWTAYLADVSGHGVPSGVLMGMVKSATRTSLTTPPPLGEMLETLNDVLYEVSQPQMFATFAALRPAGDGRMLFTLAGHLPILCWRAVTGTIDSLLVSQVPLGVLPGREFTAQETTYAAGDLFLVLTDGLTEVFDRADREFGIEGVQAVLAAHARSPLPQVIEALLTAARAHGTQLDDQSLIAIRCL
jgi:Stage II sporulation protein E (SpoIIE)